MSAKMENQGMCQLFVHAVLHQTALHYPVEEVAGTKTLGNQCGLSSTRANAVSDTD